MERKLLYEDVENILSEYCKECFVKSHFRKEHGRRFAHKFCISSCTVGEKLKLIGGKLSKQ
ncbi:zinc-finger domain-containing protein [Peribacillus saganii]|uniref:Zinc-finger domain-containing protein n=1 Tax=Peribacillus saganii TaxID=2303992 RepID=A0A372LDH8_9BACI|nr:zinc-finger domain-containing protein [Peribacillus saganii]RFU64079.1 zinc-finger domain-containing protein [Peribacillus saganii]